MPLHRRLRAFRVARRDRVAHLDMLLQRGLPGLPVLEIAGEALKIRVHALVEHLADEAHENRVAQDAGDGGVEFPIEPDGLLGRMTARPHAAEHIVDRGDVLLLDHHRCFGCNGALDELARIEHTAMKVDRARHAADLEFV